MLQSLDFVNGDRIVMADKNGIKIADSDINEKSLPFQSNHATVIIYNPPKP
jgi:hypothetical protein